MLVFKIFAGDVRVACAALFDLETGNFGKPTEREAAHIEARLRRSRYLTALVRRYGGGHNYYFVCRKAAYSRFEHCNVLVVDGVESPSEKYYLHIFVK